jgi:hypothetical protein
MVLSLISPFLFRTVRNVESPLYHVMRAEATVTVIGDRDVGAKVTHGSSLRLQTRRTGRIIAKRD